MTDIILHHYETSPYSEKVRLGLGLKGLAWGSVEIPVIMPKPDLTALTGGYRKTPVLQIGADIYCDSQLIMRELEVQRQRSRKSETRSGSLVKTRRLYMQASSYPSVFHRLNLEGNLLLPNAWDAAST